MSWQERITLDPEAVVGKPVVKGTRFAVEFIVDLLAAGRTEAEILEDYPGLTREDVRACLACASASLKAEKTRTVAERSPFKGRPVVTEIDPADWPYGPEPGCKEEWEEAAMSEASLKKDWLRPEEEEAWADL